MLGTPAFLAPELLTGEPGFDGRADIYSLGVVLYEVLAGKVPFCGETSTAVMYAHVHRQPPPPSGIVPSIPALLEAVVLRALHKDPAQRFSSGAEFIAALRPWGTTG